MGPRLFSRGNTVVAEDASERLKFASMGPRLFSRGNFNQFYHRPIECSCFNGATTFQPWKSQAVIDTDATQGELQWGHDFSAVEMKYTNVLVAHNAAGFNGATTFQPWKYHLAIVPVGACTTASMGPRLFSRGNREPYSCSCRLMRGFNGATTFQPWK